MTADTNRCTRGVAWISCRHTHSAFGCAVGTSHGHGGEVGAGEGIRTLDPSAWEARWLPQQAT